MLNSTFPSGLKASVAMFLRFSNGKVNDLLLYILLVSMHHGQEGHALDKIEHRYAVPHRTQQAVPVRGEDNVPLPVHRPADVAKLQEGQSRSDKSL